MAVAVELNFQGPNATLENYFAAIKTMGATPEGPHPDPNCVSHWVSEVDGGFRVVDVWKTKDAFERFSQERIGPVTQQSGMPQPEIKFIDVANYMTAGA